jgi:arylsulfatase A-like enzyme
VLHTDLFPTLAQLVDAPLAPGVALDGTSQVAAWLGAVDAVERAPVLLECGGATRRIGAWAVLHDEWKLHIPFDDGGVELGARLYHVSRDPTETDDVATGHPEVVRRLRHELERALAGAGWASLSDPVLP